MRRSACATICASSGRDKRTRASRSRRRWNRSSRSPGNDEEREINARIEAFSAAETARLPQGASPFGFVRLQGSAQGFTAQTLAVASSMWRPAKRCSEPDCAGSPMRLQRRFDGLRPTCTTRALPANPAGAIWLTSTALRSSPSKVHENCCAPLRKVTLSP